MVKGRTKISTVVSNLLGELQGETTQEADDVTYETLEEQIEVLIREYPKLRAVAIGIPGYITDDVVDLCNFVSLMGVPLQSRLQEKFPGLRVLVENDMNAAAFGFYRSGSVEKNATLAFIYSPVEPVKRLEEKVNEQEMKNVTDCLILALTSERDLYPAVRSFAERRDLPVKLHFCQCRLFPGIRQQR